MTDDNMRATRLISRVDLKGLLSQDDACLVSVASVKRALENETRWIPVSERLPENGDVVLASFTPRYPSNLLFGGSHVVEVTFSLNSNVWKNGTILAWMPLPKPYKAESED